MHRPEPCCWLKSSHRVGRSRDGSWVRITPAWRRPLKPRLSSSVARVTRRKMPRLSLKLSEVVICGLLAACHYQRALIGYCTAEVGWSFTVGRIFCSFLDYGLSEFCTRRLKFCQNGKYSSEIFYLEVNTAALSAYVQQTHSEAFRKHPIGIFRLSRKQRSINTTLMSYEALMRIIAIFAKKLHECPPFHIQGTRPFRRFP